MSYNCRQTPPYIQADAQLSPRVILVANEGHLVGLVTVKDVLRYEAQVEHLHTLSTSVPGSATIPREQQYHTRIDSGASWAAGGTSGNWVPVGGGPGEIMADPAAAGLEVTLEEGLRWVNQRAEGMRSIFDRFRGRGGSARGRDGVQEAMEYELEEEGVGHGPPR